MTWVRRDIIGVMRDFRSDKNEFNRDVISFAAGGGGIKDDEVTSEG